MLENGDAGREPVDENEWDNVVDKRWDRLCRNADVNFGAKPVGLIPAASSAAHLKKAVKIWNIWLTEKLIL
jgi:hypothetical protein